MMGHSGPSGLSSSWATYIILGHKYHSGPPISFWATNIILGHKYHSGSPISFWVTYIILVNLGCSSYCVKGFGWAAAAAEEIMEQPMCTWRDMIWPTLLWFLLFIIFLASFKFNFIKKFSALNMKQASSVGHMPLLIAMHNCVRTRKNTGGMQLWIKQRVQQRKISMIAALRLQGRMHPNVGEERWKWTQWKYVFWGFLLSLAHWHESSLRWQYIKSKLETETNGNPQHLLM